MTLAFGVTSAEGATLYADRRLLRDSNPKFSVDKICHVADWLAFAGAGDAVAFHTVVRIVTDRIRESGSAFPGEDMLVWLDDNILRAVASHSAFSDGSMSCDLIFAAGNQLFLADTTGFLAESTDGFVAIGSGSTAAEAIYLVGRESFVDDIMNIVPTIDVTVGDEYDEVCVYAPRSK